jgi:UDP-N-acetylglucosamine--N-acetylmuramyl-(pentapeptide) pyrophosphoryl-undecaprenol N-acetylglucosamine transferase
MAEVFDEYDAYFLSGTRYLDYQLLKHKKVKHLNSRPLRTKNPIKLILSIMRNLIVFFEILSFYYKEKPGFAVGAGGYICGPTLLAAKLMGIPIFIIEQNAVMGLTNRLLSKFSDIVFTNFKETKGFNHLNTHCFGNPIRAKIQFSKNIVNEEKINVLIFGGSLGANQINEAVKGLLEESFEFHLSIMHQVGKGNLSEREAPQNEYINYEQFEYIDDMVAAYEWSNIIISRAGASTISELRVVKRPSILIPYPAATDNHQYYNAKGLEKEKLSYITVIDHKLDPVEITKSLFLELNTIIKEKKYFQQDQIIDITSQKIKQEIINYVRNK